MDRLNQRDGRRAGACCAAEGGQRWLCYYCRAWRVKERPAWPWQKRRVCFVQQYVLADEHHHERGGVLAEGHR